MAHNNIELITNYSPKYWDLVYKQEAVTSVLDANPKLLQFTGAKTVKIGKFQNGGLNDYYRNNNANGFGDTRVPNPALDGIAASNFVGAADFGYQKSPARLTWEEFTLKCDRAAAFEIEYFDNEESGDELVGLGVTEISRTTIVPEVDAYCLSKIAEYAGNRGADGNFPTMIKDGTEDAPLKTLNEAFLYYDEKEIPADDQIVFVNPKFMAALRNTKEVTKFLTQEDYSAGKDIRFKIEKYEGRTLITVSPDRLRTNVVLHNGGYHWATQDDVTAGRATAVSEEVNFLMVAKSAVMHVVKYEKVKVISGEANLAARGFDGYTIFARIYHDVFVPDNKRVAIYLNLAEGNAAAPALEATIIKDAEGKVGAIVTNPGNVLALVVKSSTTETVGETATGSLTLVNVGDDIDGTDYYAIDAGKKVLVKATIA